MERTTLNGTTSGIRHIKRTRLNLGYLESWKFIRLTVLGVYIFSLLPKSIIIEIYAVILNTHPFTSFKNILLPMIPLFYWKGHSNFGDELSPYLVEKITGRPCFFQQRNSQIPTLIAVGSMLWPESLEGPNVIWGTGKLRPDALFLPKIKFKIFPINSIIKQLKKRRSYLHALQQPRLDIRAVRGPKTKALLENVGLKCPAIYGDPAILLPRYYSPKPLHQKFKIGLILHHSQNLSIPKELLQNSGILPISILRSNKDQIESFIDELCSCETILSASLHGIIVSQAYGIPAQWIQVEGQPIQNDDRHKFEDYFLGAGQTVQSPFKVKLSSPSMKLIFQIRPPQVLPFTSADALLNAFPFDFIEHLDSHKHA